MGKLTVFPAIEDEKKALVDYPLKKNFFKASQKLIQIFKHGSMDGHKHLDQISEKQIFLYFLKKHLISLHIYEIHSQISFFIYINVVIVAQ